MKGIYFTQTSIDVESPETYLCSKFLGAPAFPQNFLLDKDGESILSDADYFIMQINLEDVADRASPLPKKGMLYFFIDVDTLTPKILLADDLDSGTLEVYDDINDGFSDDFGQTGGYRLVFDATLDEGHCFLGEIDPNIGLESDVDTHVYVNLLEIDFLALPSEDMLRFGDLAIGGGHYVFLVKEDDLKGLDFSRVLFIDKEV